MTREFHKLCPQTKSCSQNEAPISDNHTNVSACCSSCSCEPRCRISRDCCPDAKTLYEPDKKNQESNVKCLPLGDMLSLQMNPNKSLVLKDHYLTVQSCPAEYYNETHIYGCNVPFPSRLIDTIPVVDWRTMKVYKNYHCAFCNNVTDPQVWKMETTCVGLYEMDILPESVDALRAEMKSCYVQLIPPSDIQEKLKMCRTDSYRGVVTSCNQTGHWDHYDDNVSEMCNLDSYVALFMTHQQSTQDVDYNSDLTIYKNPFCFLCNSNESTLQNFTCPPRKTRKTYKNSEDDKKAVPFKATINLDNFAYSAMYNHGRYTLTVIRQKGSSSTTRKHCGFGKYLDPYKNVCREMRCPINKYGLEGLCFPKDAKVEHLAVTITLQVHQMEAPVREYSTFFSTEILAMSVNKTLQRNLFNLCEIRNSIAKLFLNATVNVMFVSVTVATDHVCTVDSLLKLLKRIDPDVGQPLQVEQGDFQYEIAISYTGLSKNADISIVFVNGSDRDAVQLGRYFYCPRVVLSSRRYRVATESGLFDHVKDSVKYKFGDHNSGAVEVCISDYELEYWHELYNVNQTEISGGGMQVISAVCTVLSMICIVTILVTFGLFKELRFMSGKLFIVLCVNLLIAQLCYEFGMDIGGTGFVCMFIGMAIHYFWLTVVFSMNSCILLMFHHFHLPLQISSRTAVLNQNDGNATIYKYALYIYSCPSIFVLVNVITSLVMTNNQSVGYGGNICYINSALMRGLLFALPLGIIILVNFGLFCIILYDIMKIKNQSFKAESENICGQFVIFLKFSTITGVYWTFGFLYQITRVEFLGYTFVLLNAGQGVFLMASFLYNPKIISLYKCLCLRNIKKVRDSFHSVVSESVSREGHWDTFDLRSEC